MILELDTPVDVGDLDPDAPAGQYTHCVLCMHAERPVREMIVVVVTYGYLVDDEYVAGYAIPKGAASSYVSKRADWQALVNAGPQVAVSDPGGWVEKSLGGNTFYAEPLYYGLKRRMYTYLINKGVLPPGTIIKKDVKPQD